MTTALIDGDIIIHRASITAQSDVDWGDGQEGLTVNSKAAVETAKRMVESWAKKAACGSIIVMLSPKDGSNFRKGIDPEYKANRKDFAKPEAFWAVYEALLSEFKSLTVDGLEADDLLGCYGSEDPRSRVVVTLDKDLQSVPCRLLLLDKEGRPRTKKPRLIKLSEANRFWLSQTLIGDTIDNFKGCPGIGEKKAEAAFIDLNNFGSAWSTVVELFQKSGLTEQDALIQARLARILRFGEIDFNNNKICLWTPNGNGEWKNLEDFRQSSASTQAKKAPENQQRRRRSKRKRATGQ